MKGACHGRHYYKMDRFNRNHNNYHSYGNDDYLRNHSDTFVYRLRVAGREQYIASKVNFTGTDSLFLVFNRKCFSIVVYIHVILLNLTR